MHSQKSANLVSAYVLFCITAFAALAYTLAETNWDMLAYAAVVHESGASEGSDVAQLHSRVYTDLSSQVSDEDFRDIVSRDSYRETMASDAEAFQQQLPYYRIKLLFIYLLELLSAMGLSVYVAARLIVIASAGLALLVLLKAFRPYIAPVFWLLLPAVIILAGVLKTARIVSPDTLAFLAMALAVLCYLRKHWALFVVLVLCVLIRTDLLVFVFAMLFLVFVNKMASRITVFATGVASLALYMLIGKVYGGGYGWPVLFHFVLESKMLATHPLEYINASITPLAYLKVMAANVPRVIFYPGFWFCCSCSGIACVLVMSKVEHAGWRTRVRLAFAHPMLGLIMASLVYVVAHVLLFPLWETRFFVGPYTLSALCMLAVLSENFCKPAPVT